MKWKEHRAELLPDVSLWENTMRPQENEKNSHGYRRRYWRRMRQRRKTASVLFWVFFVLFLVFGSMFALSELRLRQERQQFAALAAEMEPIQTNDTAAEDAEEDRRERLAELHAANPDFVGWLQIDDTRINYPVMLCQEDAEYYLYRDMEGKNSSSGVPFLGSGCDLQSDNIIIYGHNMKNGTMFADLLRYREEDFWWEHPKISFDTLEGTKSYEVIAAFQEEVHGQEETGVFRYYAYGGTLTETEFREYAENIRRLSLYDTGKEAVYGEQLLTLSTCSYHRENGRFVVVARKCIVP